MKFGIKYIIQDSLRDIRKCSQTTGFETLLHGIVAYFVSLKSRIKSVVGNKLLCSSQVAAASDVEAVILTVYKLGRIPGQLKRVLLQTINLLTLIPLEEINGNLMRSLWASGI